MKLIKRLFANIFYLFCSLFWKKDRSVVVCGAWFGEKFADNPRFLFQYLSDNKAELGLKHVVWVCHSEQLMNKLRDMGYEAYILGSKESIHFHKIAKYHICNNSPSGSNGHKNELDAKYSFRAVRINLWHGIGIKGGKYCSKAYIDKKKKHKTVYNLCEYFLKYKIFRLLLAGTGGWGDCYWLSTTPACTDYVHKWMLGPVEHYLELDYPRNQPCLKYTAEEKNTIDILKQYKKVVLYLPTYRDNGKEICVGDMLRNMSGFLKENDILWIQKAHTAATSQEKIDDSNIMTLDSSFDINVLLAYISILVTDYSSVSIDAIYHKKPVVYFVPDWDDYMNGNRGMVVKPENYFAGKMVDNENLLMEAIANPPEHDEHYWDIRRRYWKDNVGYKEIWNGLSNL